MTTTDATAHSAATTHVPIGGKVWLAADVTMPADARGAVLFAHGSGSSRLSPRNRFVASMFNEQHLATVLADLLTPEEQRMDDRTAALRFDVPLLTERLIGVIDWAYAYNFVSTLPLGIFGASTGAAAALDAAVARPAAVRAVVCRGGRLDLAKSLGHVTAPTLLIVGGNDKEVLALNARALEQIPAAKELRVIPGATHLFEEPGALEAVASAASLWFLTRLKS